MDARKPAALVTTLHQPRPLCCQHCFAAQSLMPIGALIEPRFGPMGLHVDLVHSESSHEMPREFNQGMGVVALDMRCRREPCQKFTTLVITTGENGTFLQLVAAEEPEDDENE